MPRASPRKKAAVNYTESDTKPTPNGTPSKRKPSAKPDQESADKGKKASGKGAIGTALAKAREIAASAPPKRKAEEPAVKEEDEKLSLPKGKKRKTKKDKEEDMAPLAERTAVQALKKGMYIGAHVSAAGGVQNSVTNAVQIGANAFALFLKSQRKWDNPPLAPEARTAFISGCKTHSYAAHEHALPHGSYLVNLAQADPAKASQAYNTFVDDLKRCHELGIRLYNFHPGSTGGDDRSKAIERIAGKLNEAHKEQGTGDVVTVLENMAGGGNVVGSTWEDLRDVIKLVDDKERVGVCIDTCHAFAAGYDLRSEEAFKETMDKFNEIVGMKYLKAFHLNDSKAPFNSHRDLHANIGTGFLGLRAFHNVLNCDAFRGMPMVLETPIDKKNAFGKSVEDKQVWADEIKLLESLIGMDVEGEEFRRLEVELQERGKGERERVQGQVDKKKEKDSKKGKGRKKKGASEDEDSE